MIGIRADGDRVEEFEGGKELIFLCWLRSVDLGFRSITTPMPGARHNALSDSSSNASPGKLEGRFCPGSIPSGFFFSFFCCGVAFDQSVVDCFFGLKRPIFYS